MTAEAPCPNEGEHTPSPASYVGWFEWAARMNYLGFSQSRCPGCGLYEIWRGSREPADPRDYDQGCLLIYDVPGPGDGAASAP